MSRAPLVSSLSPLKTANKHRKILDERKRVQ